MKTFDSKDASFSSYLIPQKPNTCQPNHQTLEDSTSELSIFDAHKYFNEVTNNNNIQKVTITNNSNSTNNNNSRVSPVLVNAKTESERIIIPETTTRYSSASSLDSYSNIRNYRTRSFHAATPTASSEASWNSQQGLLSHPPGAISVSMKNPSNLNPNNDDLNNNKFKTSLSKPIWLFRRKCPCSGKKSVQVNEKKSTQLPKTKNIPSPSPQLSPNTMNMESNFNPQNNWVNVDQTETNIAVKSQRFSSQSHNSVVTTVRVPVPFTEGFTFPVLNTNATSSAKLKVQNGVVLEDAPRDSLEVFRPPDEVVAVEAKPVNFAFLPAMSRVVVTDDGDAASDASSDLFEIESFSTGTQSMYPPGVCRISSRDSFDETPAMTECYEPSEASIEWSVTTADGYDEGSCGGGVGGSVGAEQWKRKGGNGLLVSCRCEKAVSVGPHPLPVKCGGGGSTSAWRHVSGVGSVNKPPIGKLHSHSHSHSHHRNNTPRVTSIAFAT